MELCEAGKRYGLKEEILKRLNGKKSFINLKYQFGLTKHFILMFTLKPKCPHSKCLTKLALGLFDITIALEEANA